MNKINLELVPKTVSAEFELKNSQRSLKPQQVSFEAPDMRQPDFNDLALALPTSQFRDLMSRDDLTCYEEKDILNLV